MQEEQTATMDFLYIFMNHLCPAFGAVIALMMFSAPMKAVLAANRAKDLGVSKHDLDSAEQHGTPCWCCSCNGIAAQSRLPPSPRSTDQHLKCSAASSLGPEAGKAQHAAAVMHVLQQGPDNA